MNIMSYVKKRSLWMLHVGCSGCNACSVELSACFEPRYDIERYGIRAVDSPEYADILVITGAINEKSSILLEATLKRTYKPIMLMAVGNCACSGGVFQQKNNYFKAVSGIENADVYVPGCPPEPKVIIDGFKIAIQKNADSDMYKSKREQPDENNSSSVINIALNETALNAANSEAKKSV